MPKLDYSITYNIMRNFMLMLLVMVSSGAAAEWVKTGSTSGSGGYEIYVDPATISRNGDTVKMWQMIDFKTVQVTPDGKRHLSLTAQYEYDCKGTQWRLIIYAMHQENMGHGLVFYSDGIPVASWRPVSPESVGEENLKLACGAK